MAPFRLTFGFLRAALAVIVLVIAFPFLIGHEIYQRVNNEWLYYHQYGADWQQRFLDEQHVSVDEVNKQIMVGAGGIVVVLGLIFLIYRQAVPKSTGRSQRRRRRSRSSST